MRATLAAFIARIPPSICRSFKVSFDSPACAGETLPAPPDVTETREARMKNPNAAIYAIPRGSYSPRFMAIVAFVAVIHGVALWALINGLAPVIVKIMPPDLFTRVLLPQNQPAPPPPPTQPTTMRLPQTPTAVPPVIDDNPQNMPSPIAVTPHPNPAVAESAAMPVFGTHTTPPYPPLASRLGQEGTVQLRITVAPDGTVADVEVVKSSGYALLDRTAADWVKAHWRYSPAIRAGAPVASTMPAAVNFDLENAR
jgi:periplasmic protein TonB